MKNCRSRIRWAATVCVVLALFAGRPADVYAQATVQPPYAVGRPDDRIPPTPRVCDDSASAAFTRAIQATGEEKKQGFGDNPDALKQWMTARTSALRSCIERMHEDRLRGSEVAWIASQYAAIHAFEKADAAGLRFARDTTLSDSVRLEGLSTIVSAYVSADAAATWRVEPLFAEIDRLAVTNVQKFAVHRRAYVSYRVSDIDLGVRAQALAMITLSKGVKAFVRTAETPTLPLGTVDAGLLLAAYENAAMVLGNFGDERRALLLLDEARREHPEIEPKYFSSAFDETATRLRVVGTRAPLLESTHWFNAPDHTTSLPFNGRVTVVGFTAHWCPPCMLTYAPFRAMSDSLAKRGAQFVFATMYYGFVADAKKLTEAQETDSLRSYYLDKEKITFPVAVLGRGVDLVTGDLDLAIPAYKTYGIRGIPTAVIIDRKGIVRRTIVGWDPANSERIPALLASLLREK